MNVDNFKEQFKITNIIFYALLIWQLLFYAFAFWFSGSEGFTVNKELDEIFQFLIPLFGFTVMITSRFLYNKNISTVDEKEDVANKLAKYRTFKIIQWAMVEGASTIAIIGLMLTGNHLYSVVFIFLIGYFILIKPSNENFTSEMKISSTDSQKY